MAKMKVNWKQLFVEKGERIGLGVAGFLSVVMIVPMIMYLFTGPSSEAVSKELENATNQLKSKQASASPSAGDLPPPKSPADENDPTARLDRPTVDGSGYARLEVVGLEPQVDKTKRLKPNVLSPAEGHVAVAGMQLKSFVMDVDRLMTLEGGTGTNPMGAPMSQDYYKAFQQRLQGGKRPGGGAPGAGMMYKPQEGVYNTGNKDKTDLKSGWVKFDDLGNNTPHLADTVQPKRVAVIVAAFPYKAQIQEFKNKLHLKTDFDVVEEIGGEDAASTPDGTTPIMQPKTGKHTFYFVSPLVERRVVDAHGTPQPGAEWTAVDLETDYKELLRWNGMRFEQEPFELDAIGFDGLTMPKLQAMEKNQWPDETKMGLKTLDATVKRIKELNKPKVVKPKNPYDPKDFNPFSKQRIDLPVGGPGSTIPPTSTPPPGADTSAEYPDYCMIRLIDVNIKAGQYYEYRIKVRMGNPNIGMKDKVASPNFASDDKPLEAAQWFEIRRKDEAPQVVTVPPEYHLYPIDQKELETKYDGQNEKHQVAKDHEAAFQIHKWLEETDAHQAVGEWSVAERSFAFRGEYIGRKERVEVPYWRPTMESFVLAVEPNVGKNPPKTKGIVVDFGVPPTEGRPATDYPILVDFDGGTVTYKRIIGKDDNGKEKYLNSSDTAGVEALILMPDGKLVAKNSWSAKVDSERIKRLEDWRARIKDVKDGKATGANNTGSGDGPDPFKKDKMP